MNEPPVGCCTPDSPYRSTSKVDVWVFPSFIDLHSTHFHGLITGAQCGHPTESGAYTGDVSMKMLANQKIHAVLCGHSERRQYHGETNEQVAAQVKSALAVGLCPIVCVGETQAQRDADEAKKIVAAQLASIPLDQDLTIAYEPVWAIGTGRTATPEQAQEMHAFIRSLLPDSRRNQTRILYGGSVKAENAASLFQKPDIDGALVGGASLKPAEFREIVEAA